MKYRYLVLVLSMLPLAGFSQHFIGKKKAAVMKFLQAEKSRQDSLEIVITEDASNIYYSVKPGKTQAADFIYNFGPDGKCRTEKVKASCDSCFRKYLQKALDNKKLGWKKINENQYVSRYASRMMIELPPEANDYSFVILHSDWNRKLYKLLLQ